MAVTTSGVFGKVDCPQGALSKLWYNSTTNAATVDVIMCNRSESNAKIRIAIIPSSTNIVSYADYILYNYVLAGGETYTQSGIVLSTQETIFVFSDILGVSARVHGFVNDAGPAITDIGVATQVNYGLTQYAAGFDVVSEDKAATPKLVKTIIDAYGGSTSTGGNSTSLTKMILTLTAPNDIDAVLTVPTYIVGRNHISLFINGVLAQGGNDRSMYAYEEIGDDGNLSTSIKIFDRYDTGTEFMAVV